MHKTTITLPHDLKARAQQRAKKKGVSLGELIREALEAHLKHEEPARRENPFFQDQRVFTGDVPSDLSRNHDEYLYGDQA